MITTVYLFAGNGVLLSGGDNTYRQLRRGREEGSGLSPFDMGFGTKIGSSCSLPGIWDSSNQVSI